MALTVLFAGSVAKHTEAPSENEDAYRLAPGRIVLSDGASESFDARSWASLLVDHMVDQDLSLEAVEACANAYEALHDPNALSWSKAAAYERGSFATLLVAQDFPESNIIQVTAIGDSAAVFLDGDEYIASFPYEHSEQFLENPILLSTRLALNTPSQGSWMSQVWSYKESGRRFLLCMTDALGAWALAHQEQGDPSALEILRGIRELGEFEALVEAERAAGRMRRDDTTLIVASVQQD